MVGTYVKARSKQPIVVVIYLIFCGVEKGVRKFCSANATVSANAQGK